MVHFIAHLVLNHVTWSLRLINDFGAFVCQKSVGCAHIMNILYDKQGTDTQASAFMKTPSMEHYWPFGRGATGDQRIPRTKGQ